MDAVNTPCGKAQEAYDRITRHGTNDVKEADAMKRAVEEVTHPKAAEK